MDSLHASILSLEMPFLIPLPFSLSYSLIQTTVNTLFFARKTIEEYTVQVILSR